jgi:hypothetical protein
MKSAHIPLLAVLSIGLGVTIYIGVTSTFTLFNAKGLLSGPFSGLLLIGAAEFAALVLVLLDWSVWKPRNRARAAAIERWLAVNVLGNREAPAENWEALHGSFRGRTVTVRRGAQRRGLGMEAWRWSAKTGFKGTFRTVRISDADAAKAPAATAETPLSTGDAEFEARYQWQSDRPEEVVKLLKGAEFRAAIKRLASLFSRHGKIADSTCGVTLEQGDVVLLQVPAPVFARANFAADELLLILHDLTLTAAALEGTEPPAAQPLATPPELPGSPWLAFGCAGGVLLLLWLSGTYGAARFVGLPAAMIVFFMPALALALWFIVLSATGSGRDPEIEAAIEVEARREIAGHMDLAKLAGGLGKYR